MSHHRSMLKQFCQKQTLDFTDIALLEKALTHSSFVNEHRSEDYEDNERLEYLGDAVLELAMSQFLFTEFQDLNEGELTKLRAQHVCEPALVTYAQEMGLGEYLRLGKGEELSGGRERPAILADAFEALLGAIFLNIGYDRVYQLLDQIVFPLIRSGSYINVIDYKSKLQELVQTDSTRSIRYEIVSESGPAHNKIFESLVFMDDIKMGSGSGRSKKEAEQNAAKVALGIMAEVDIKDHDMG